MVEQRFSDLTQRCINIMGEAGYSRQTIERYSQLWSCYIKPFIESRGTDIYSMDVGIDFLSSMSEDVEKNLILIAAASLFLTQCLRVVKFVVTSLKQPVLI